MREHGGAQGEQREAASEHERATRKYINETSFNEEVKRRDLNQQTITYCIEFEKVIYIYTYYIHFELKIKNFRFQLKTKIKSF